MVRVANFEWWPFLFALNWEGWSRFLSECDGYGTFLLRYYKGSVSVSGKASGIIYENEHWIGPSAELRIHHYLFGYNTIVVSLIVFFSS